MKQMLAIAKVTYREAIRNRVLYSLLFFLVGLVLIAAVLDGMTTGQNGRVVINLGLAGVHLFGALITVFLCVSAMSQELSRKTIYVVLAKPVGRGAFLLGKYLGLTATLGLLVAVMGVSLMAVAVFFGVVPSVPLMHALLMTWVELAVIAAVALLFAAVSGPFLSGMFTVGVFCIGHLSTGLKTMGEESGDSVIAALTTVVYYLFPNLEAFNFKLEALYQTPVVPMDSLLAVLYAVTYSAALLALAAMLFSRRDFR
jgi:ABC-type transport system involved in multi-copper enzyme maturation permease subunit